MRNGWVKLHRKIIDNDFLKRDTNAFKVFITLLLLVDRKTGVWEGGRFQLAEHCGLKPTTTYGASMRLVKAKMMTLRSNNKYSTYIVSNWESYQQVGNNNDDNKMTTSRQQDDTLTRSKEVKNKEEYGKQWLVSIPTKDKTYFEKKYPNTHLEEEIERAINWLNMNGKRYKNYKAFLENWMKRATEFSDEKQKIEVGDVEIPEYLRLHKLNKENNVSSLGKKND